MSISIRIVVLVVMGFLVSVMVGGTAIRHISTTSKELSVFVGRDLPLVRTLTAIALEATENALRVEQRLDAVAEDPSPTDNSLSADARTVGEHLRRAGEQASNAMPPASDPTLFEMVEGIAWLVAAQNQYADTIDQFLHLATLGRTEAARAMVPDIKAQRERIIEEIGELLVKLEDRTSAAVAATRKSQDDRVFDIVLVSGFGLVVCVLIGLAIGHGITRPLGRLTESMRRLVRGDTSEDLHLPNVSAEIAAMVDAVNAFRAEIIDHRKTIVALTESEKRFHTLAALAPVGVFFTDAEGECRYVNEAWSDIAGLSIEDARGMAWASTLDPDDAEAVSNEWYACVNENRPFKMEYRFRRPDGRVSWVIGQGAVQVGLDGNIEGYVGTVTDITQRKLTEEALRHSEQTRAALHRIATDQTLSLDAKIQKVLELGATVLNLPLGIVSRIHGSIYQVLHVLGPDNKPEPGTTFPVGDTYCVHTLKASGPVAFHRAGTSEIANHPCYRKFGLEAYIGAPIVVDGKPFGTLNFSGPDPRRHPFTNADLSLVHHFADWIGHEMARAKSHQARRESARRLQTVFETVVEGIVTIDDRGRIESVNPAVERIFGYEPGELVGRNINILMPEPYHSAHDGYLARYRETGRAGIIGVGREVVGRRKDGSVFPVDLAINEMRIGKQRMFTGTVRDITERKRVEKLKDEFVSSVSHELRTPLTSIRGSLGLVLGGTAGGVPEKMEPLLRIAHSNSQRLIALVNDILDLQKIESGRLDFRFEGVDAQAVLDTAIEANGGFADEFGVTLTVEGPVPDAVVHADPARLSQVMGNLVSNAAKFSPRDGIVRLSARRLEGGLVRFAVADDGPGIPKAFQGRIFERFSQADSSDTRRVGGTGLGLSIAKGIVERHGGRIDFETEAGVGTTFFFDLPERGGIDPVRSTAPGRVKGRILICEDDPDVARLLSMMLAQDGYATATAHDAAQAKERLRNEPFDAITVDIMLPDASGLALMQELREDAATRDLAMIVVSAKAQEAQGAIEGVGLGVIDWLDKPIDETRLLASVERATSLSGQDRPQLLYVENDADLVRVIEALLDGTADLTVAGSIADAATILKRGKFDLVLLDIGLPDGSGLELLPLIKDDAARPTPVIVFSGQEIEGKMSEMVETALVKSRTSNEALLRTIKRFIRPGGGRSRKETAR